MASRETTPFLLSTGATALTGTVTALVPSGQQALPVEGLTNTLGVPVEVTEIVFTIDEDNDASPPGGVALAWEIMLNAGRYPITPDFCPIAALGMKRDSDIVEGNGASTSAVSADTIRWILPRPLVLGPGEALHGAVRLTPDITYLRSGTAHVSMCARGRRLASNAAAAGPRVIPYASGTFFTVADRPVGDTILQNTCGGILHVASINMAPLSWGATYPTTDTAGRVVGGRPEITVTGPGGLANQVLRSIAVGVDEVGFFGQRNALEVAHDLEPREGYTISLRYPTVTDVYSGTAIALIGWREE